MIAEQKILSQFIGEVTGVVVKNFALENMDGDSCIEKGVWYSEKFFWIVRDDILVSMDDTPLLVIFLTAQLFVLLIN